MLYEIIQKHILDQYRLTSGEDFSELEGSIVLRRSTAENDDKPVGFLTYIPEFKNSDSDLYLYTAAAYSADCKLPARQFDELVSVARQGRMPTSISVNVVGEGAKMGWEPDGSGFDWDNKEHPTVAVSEIGFVLPYISPTDPEDYDEDSEKLGRTAPASQAQLEQLLQKIDELEKTVRLLAGVAVFTATILAVEYIRWSWFN